VGCGHIPWKREVEGKTCPCVQNYLSSATTTKKKKKKKKLARNYDYVSKSWLVKKIKAKNPSGIKFCYLKQTNKTRAPFNHRTLLL
jgi:hypothetical protein